MHASRKGVIGSFDFRLCDSVVHRALPGVGRLFAAADQRAEIRLQDSNVELRQESRDVAVDVQFDRNERIVSLVFENHDGHEMKVGHFFRKLLERAFATLIRRLLHSSV